MKDKMGGDMVLYLESGTKIISLISEKLTISFKENDICKKPCYELGRGV